MDQVYTVSPYFTLPHHSTTIPPRRKRPPLWYASLYQFDEVRTFE